ncbi:UNVERIFIED_CONTAM: hypothetical protein Slati_1095800 [Sesamum latifolium]|uniref:Uncharacterized protein n=1 Tax=Sesamum latifolium TaxID=2727402 RepID=A0AAW2XUW1_9LAMI
MDKKRSWRTELNVCWLKNSKLRSAKKDVLEKCQHAEKNAKKLQNELLALIETQLKALLNAAEWTYLNGFQACQESLQHMDMPPAGKKTSFLNFEVALDGSPNPSLTFLF